MAPAGVPNATVAKPADGSFKQYDEAKIQPSSNRPVSSISKGWEYERLAGFSASITRRSLAGWHKLAQALPASPPQTEAGSFIEIDELCAFIAKKSFNVGSG